MEAGTRLWDDDMLKDIFNENDIQLIKSIHIPAQDREDSWLWN